MRKRALGPRSLIIPILLIAFACLDAQAGPDIALLSIEVDQPAYRPNSDMIIDFSYENVGDERPAEVLVNFYLSEDTTITADDIHLDWYLRSGPLPGTGGSYFHRERLRMADYFPGEYYLGAIVTCAGDINQDNDTLCMDTIISFNGSDLTMASMDLSGFSDAGPGPGRVTLNYCVENTGAMESAGYRVSFYASTDTTITLSDHYLGRDDRGTGVSPGATRCGADQLDFEGLPPGDYYIGAIIESDSELDDLSNNVSSTSGTVALNPRPDLSIRSLRFEHKLFRPGDSVSIHCTVANTGSGVADSYTVDFYATDRHVFQDDYHLGSKKRSDLEVGDEDEFRTSCRFPSDMPADDYEVVAIVTCSDDINTGNNSKKDSSGTFRVGWPADLTVQSVQITPGVYAPDAEIAVSGLVENTGALTSQPYTIVCCASADAVITKDDYRLDTVARSGLRAGQTDRYEATVRAPFSIPAGPCYIGLIVICPDEYDASNNVRRSTAPIELVHPPRYLCGHAQYKYNNFPMDQIYYPLRCARVQILESDNNQDPLDDRLLGQTHTDPNGNYAFTFSSDEEGNDRLYVKVSTEGVSGAYPDTTSKICSLKDDVFHEPYSLISHVHAHPGEASVVVNLTAPVVLGELLAFDSVVEGFSKAKTFFDVELEEITAYWPSEDDETYFDPCEVEIFIAQDDCKDRDVVMHEYGHYIAETYGVALGAVGGSSEHYWDEDLRQEPLWRSNEHAMNLAFREAWPTLFCVATQYGDTGYPNSGDSKYTDTDTNANWTFSIDLDNHGTAEFSPGQFYENMNAGALWDVFDHDDDGVEDNDTVSDASLAMIWAISRDHQPENILDFWNSWFLHYEHDAAMKYIFETHEMNFDIPK